MSTFNVIKDYDWTSSPRGSGLRSKTPRLILRSYKFTKSQVFNRALGYVNVVNMDTDEYYDKLYSEATEGEDVFFIPYFGDSVRSFGNTFGDTFQNGFGGGGGIGEALDATVQGIVGASAQVGSAVGTESINNAMRAFGDQQFAEGFAALGRGGSDPGTYIETPKMYQYENTDAPLEASFILSNTINSDFQKNYDLVQKLTRINRPDRKNSISMDPPRIYQLRVSGHRYMRWAYCSSFSVTLLGTKREIDKIIVPEAYQVNMAFTSLTVESANFLDKVSNN